MDQNLIYLWPILGFFFLLIVLTANDAFEPPSDSKDSVECVKVGGTWNQDKLICESNK